MKGLVARMCGRIKLFLIKSGNKCMEGNDKVKRDKCSL